jgi:hypothetical protein
MVFITQITMCEFNSQSVFVSVCSNGWYLKPKGPCVLKPPIKEKFPQVVHHQTTHHFLREHVYTQHTWPQTLSYPQKLNQQTGEFIFLRLNYAGRFWYTGTNDSLNIYGNGFILRTLCSSLSIKVYLMMLSVAQTIEGLWIGWLWTIWKWLEESGHDLRWSAIPPFASSDWGKAWKGLILMNQSSLHAKI